MLTLPNTQRGSRTPKRRIVVVGGGIAGLVLATRLGRSRQHDVLLLDRNFSHVWKPMLHRFAAGTATDATQTIPFASQAKQNGFRYWPGELVGLDRSRKEIRLGLTATPDRNGTLPERSIAYDTLVLAYGSCSDDFGTTGVADHCLFVDDLGQARAVHEALRSRMLEAAAQNAEELAVVIVGGGATGVELAAELTESSELVARYSPVVRSPGYRITLIERGPRLLAPFPEAVSLDATSKLNSLGIVVKTGTRVVSVDDQGITIEGGGRIDASVRIWAAGVRSPAVSRNLDGLSINGKGQVIVRGSLQSENDDDIFALGDCASFVGQDGKPLPTTAQVARQQALFLARSFLKRLEAGQSRPAFAYSDKGSIVTLGPYAAYASIGRHGFFRATTIRGPLAQIGHAALYRMHQLDLLGAARGCFGWIADALLRAVRPKLSLD